MSESQSASRDALRRARRVVVKIGSALLTNDGRGLDEFAAAIFAHGGEAQSARDAYAGMNDVERAELRVFLRGFTRAPRIRVAGP